MTLDDKVKMVVTALKRGDKPPDIEFENTAEIVKVMDRVGKELGLFAPGCDCEYCTGKTKWYDDVIVIIAHYADKAGRWAAVGVCIYFGMKWAEVVFG